MAIRAGAAARRRIPGGVSVRVNVYSQEITPEVLEVSKVSNTGIEYKAVQFILHSSQRLHHPPADDDRSAVTFWLPQSAANLDALYKAFADAASIVFRIRHGLEPHRK